MKTPEEWQQRLQQIARDAGKPELNPVLLMLCADQLAQWEKLTEELATRPALADELCTDQGLVRTIPPEFNMQAKAITAIRLLLKDLGLVELSVEPLKKLRNRLLTSRN